MLRSVLVQSSALCVEAPRVQAAAIVYSDLTLSDCRWHLHSSNASSDVMTAPAECKLPLECCDIVAATWDRFLFLSASAAL